MSDIPTEEEIERILEEQVRDGLVERHGDGYRLTAKGLAAVEALVARGEGKIQ